MNFKEAIFLEIDGRLYPVILHERTCRLTVARKENGVIRGPFVYGDTGQRTDYCDGKGNLRIFREVDVAADILRVRSL